MNGPGKDVDAQGTRAVNEGISTVPDAGALSCLLQELPLPVLVVRARSGWRLLFANDAARRYLGFTDRLEGRDLLALVADVDRQALEAGVAALAQSAQPETRVECQGAPGKMPFEAVLRRIAWSGQDAYQLALVVQAGAFQP